MSAIGSLNNPYTYSDYSAMYNNSTWSGGWVQNGAAITYYSHDNVQYTGKGEYSHPFPIDIYNEMSSHGIWIGGWTIDNNHTKYYYDRNGVSYNDTLGLSSDPCPVSIYSEMCGNGIWNGGWVEYNDGTTHYIQEFTLSEDNSDGCGCGCSSGCGSESSGSEDTGCGCDSDNSGSQETGYEPASLGRITSGQEVVGTLFSGKAELRATWDEGFTNGASPTASLSFSIVFIDSEYELIECHVNGQWVDNYEASIQGSIKYTFQQEIHIVHIYGGSFSVPVSYHCV